MPSKIKIDEIGDLIEIRYRSHERLKNPCISQDLVDDYVNWWDMRSEAFPGCDCHKRENLAKFLVKPCALTPFRICTVSNQTFFLQISNNEAIALSLNIFGIFVSHLLFSHPQGLMTFGEMSSPSFLCTIAMITLFGLQFGKAQTILP